MSLGVVALICARGGSKGLPGKNIRPLAGRPLLAWAVAQAQAVPRISRVLVSTDDEAIAAAAEAAGAEVPFRRPAALAGDDAPEWAVWQHALRFLEASAGGLPEALVVVPPTAPLRHADDIGRCLDDYDRGDVDLVITVTDAHRSPYFNMVTLDAAGRASVVLPLAERVTRRQTAPVVYDMTTVAYVARPEFVLQSSGVFDGRVRAVHVPVERSWDIDTAFDFQVVEALMARSVSGG